MSMLRMWCLTETTMINLDQVCGITFDPIHYIINIAMGSCEQDYTYRLGSKRAFDKALDELKVLLQTN